MKVRKTSYPPINIGTSFMLIIFLILCMVIFAALSLSTALRDYRYSEKNARLTTEYYEANNLAQERLAQIDEAIKNGSISESTVEFTVPINDSEILQVVLRIHPDEEERCTITTWKQISIADWDGDETLPVLGSDSDKTGGSSQ